MKRLLVHTLVAVSPVVAFALAPSAPRLLAAPPSYAASPALAAPSAAACESVSGLKIADTTIVSATAQPAGTFTPPGAAAGRGGRGMADMPAFCRVQAVAKPTPTSNIQFEVWLPAEGWNGKLQVVGNGGLAGTIGYAAMATALRAGFATASTDTGHTSSEPPTWMADRERLIDYSYRGLHLTTADAKSIIQAYYTAQALSG
jgi:feruloyl esterase